MYNNSCSSCKKEKKKNKSKYTENEFIDNIPEELRNKITIMSSYINTITKVKIKCNLCGREWWAYPINLIKNHGCLICNNPLKKTHQQFIDELSKKNKDVLILTEYKNTDTKIKFKCLKCGKEHMASPYRLLQGRGCISCKKSLGESKINIWLTNNNIFFEEEKTFEECRYKNKLRFDFFLPNYNLCIEYDGEQHFEDTYHWITNTSEFTNIPQNRERTFIVCFLEGADAVFDSSKVMSQRFNIIFPPKPVNKPDHVKKYFENEKVDEKFYYRENKYMYDSLVSSINSTDRKSVV
jgi:DNA-directed RNA polymerase subunit M/transcription elongation factor TFIIS